MATSAEPPDAGLGGRVPRRPGSEVPRSDAEALLAALRAAGRTVAFAESLTGGLACATLVAVAGASEVVRGGVVAYATDVKASVLGVDPQLLARRGAVDPEVAAQMARGARRVLGADYGAGVTGVAGPRGQDGRDPGTVFLAVAGPDGEVRGRALLLEGDRDRIRAAGARSLIGLVLEQVGSAGPSPAAGGA